jgi:ABC-2 type transport system permease protein
MRLYTGFWPLLRLALRRDRVKLPVWLLSLAFATFYFANALQVAYPEEADLEAIAGFMDSPAGTVMSGPGYGWDHPTHATAFAGAYGLYLYLGAAFMTVLLVSRHTRAEEEAGRLELVRAAEVGRHAPLAVTGVLTVGASLALGVLSALFLTPADYGVAGSWLFGMSMAMVALVFGGIALVTAQLSEHSRSATGLASLAIGAAVVIRGAGDVLEQNGSWLSWLSPIAWAQQTRVFYDDRWWPLLLGVALAGVMFGLASRLQARRDLGAGLLATRPGSPRAAAYLRSPLALSMRLERGSMIGWAVALFVLGALYGALTDSVQSSLGDLDNQMLIDAMGGDPARMVDGYLATCALFNGYVALCYAIVAAHRLTAEERDGRAEVVLATAVSRSRWLLAGFTTALAGTLVALLAAGVGMGGTAALVTGEAGYFGDVLLGTAYYLPAIALLLGIAVVGFAFRPGWLNVAWIAAVYAMVVGYLGFVLDLPDVMVDLSPLSHIAQVPLETQDALPLVVLTLIAAGLVVAGLARFRTRDLTTG